MDTFLFKKELQIHGISPNNAIVCGSSSIAARYDDFRHPGDVDLVVSFFEFIKLLLLRGWHCVMPKDGASWREIRIERDGYEAFLCWKLGMQYVSYKTLKHESMALKQVRFANLTWIKRYKRCLKREKDMRDLAFLRMHHA